MASLKQLAANRLNAAKSTGPRTEAGKSASRLNALKSGIDAQSHILPGESPEDFASLTAEYHERHCPVTPEQRALVDVLISSEWLLRRLRRVEHQLWEREFESIANEKYANTGRPFSLAYHRLDETLQRHQRRIDSTWRQYQQALRTLRQLQTDAEAVPEPLSVEPVTPEIGFVPANHDVRGSAPFETPSPSPHSNQPPLSKHKPAA